MCHIVDVTPLRFELRPGEAIFDQVEQLVVEAKRVGLELTDVVQEIEAQWVKLDKHWEVSRK